MSRKTTYNKAFKKKEQVKVYCYTKVKMFN